MFPFVDANDFRKHHIIVVFTVRVLALHTLLNQILKAFLSFRHRTYENSEHTFWDVVWQQRITFAFFWRKFTRFPKLVNTQHVFTLLRLNHCAVYCEFNHNEREAFGFFFRGRKIHAALNPRTLIALPELGLARCQRRVHKVKTATVWTQEKEWYMR